MLRVTEKAKMSTSFEAEKSEVVAYDIIQFCPAGI